MRPFLSVPPAGRSQACPVTLLWDHLLPPWDWSSSLPHPGASILLSTSPSPPSQFSKPFHLALEHTSEILQKFQFFKDYFLHSSLTKNLAPHDVNVYRILDSSQMEDVPQIPHTTVPGVPGSLLLVLHYLFQIFLCKHLCFKSHAIRLCHLYILKSPIDLWIHSHFIQHNFGHNFWLF